MLYLTNLRDTRFWNEVHAEGRQEGREEAKVLFQMEAARKLVAQGKAAKDIAEFLEISLSAARELIKQAKQ